MKANKISEAYASLNMTVNAPKRVKETPKAVKVQRGGDMRGGKK